MEQRVKYIIAKLENALSKQNAVRVSARFQLGPSKQFVPEREEEHVIRPPPRSSQGKVLGKRTKHEDKSEILAPGPLPAADSDGRGIVSAISLAVPAAAGKAALSAGTRARLRPTVVVNACFKKRKKEGEVLCALWVCLGSVSPGGSASTARGPAQGAGARAGRAGKTEEKGSWSFPPELRFHPRL